MRTEPEHVREARIYSEINRLNTKIKRPEFWVKQLSTKDKSPIWTGFYTEKEARAYIKNLKEEWGIKSHIDNCV